MCTCEDARMCMCALVHACVCVFECVNGCVPLCMRFRMRARVCMRTRVGDGSYDACRYMPLSESTSTDHAYMGDLAL